MQSKKVVHFMGGRIDVGEEDSIASFGGDMNTCITKVCVASVLGCLAWGKNCNEPMKLLLNE